MPDPPDTLPPLVRALLDPAAYPPPRPASVELRQTHISYVLLADERVYKLKKAVALGFLDYSTPRRRAYYCQREVALNRRLAPDVYLGVVPIVERDGSFHVGGRGRTVERAVLMRRLPEAGMLSALLARGAVTPALLSQLAARLAAFHAAAAHGPAVARHGAPPGVRRLVLGNLHRAAPYVGRTLTAATYTHLCAWTATFLAGQRPLLRARVHAGRIRDGHGDLHAANVCVVDAASLHTLADRPPGPSTYGLSLSLGPATSGRPELHPAPQPLLPPPPILPPSLSRTAAGQPDPLLPWATAGPSSDPTAPDEPVIFDCIDFSPPLRCTDVAAEIAFLAMDLDHHGRADLAAAFVDAYVAASDDADLRALLPFYLSYRATVRGLVASITADAAALDAAGRAAQESLARGYFDLARYAYAGGAPRPLLLLLGGLPASGKSTLAQALAGRLALVPLNSDVVRKQRAGLPPTTRATTDHGAGLYTASATEHTYAALVAAARGWLARGVSVALDASFRRADHRAQAITAAEALGVPWLAVECVCPPDVARARLAARTHDPAAVSDADWRVYQQLAAEWEPWTELPPARHHVVSTADDLDTASAAILAAASAHPR